MLELELVGSGIRSIQADSGNSKQRETQAAELVKLPSLPFTSHVILMGTQGSR
jgi:hypothetical protein